MKLRRILLGLAAIGALWGGYYLWCVRAKVVTLSVRNMDVRKVVKKIEWQTWERILVNKDVRGVVTLNVHRVPLADVLDIIALQADCSWTRLYPLYRTRGSAETFRKVVLGAQPPTSSWLSLQKMAAWQRSGVGGFANTTRAANQLISAQFLHKDLDFAALALSRFSKAEVVPEQGPSAMIDLKLAEVTFDKAVAKVAKQARRKWERLYTLQPLRAAATIRPGNGAGAPTQLSGVSQVLATALSMMERAKQSAADASATNQATAPAPVDLGNKELQTEAFLATMTPAERRQAQTQLAAQAELNALPPAERQQRMQAMAAQASQSAQGDLEQRIQNRLKNGTVDWRVSHDRSQLEKQRRAPKP